VESIHHPVPWEELPDIFDALCALEPERDIDVASTPPGLGTSKRPKCLGPKFRFRDEMFAAGPAIEGEGRGWRDRRMS
jgi:hypothetical protein